MMAMRALFGFGFGAWFCAEPAVDAYTLRKVRRMNKRAGLYTKQLRRHEQREDTSTVQCTKDFRSPHFAETTARKTAEAGESGTAVDALRFSCANVTCKMDCVSDPNTEAASLQSEPLVPIANARVRPLLSNNGPWKEGEDKHGVNGRTRLTTLRRPEFVMPGSGDWNTLSERTPLIEWDEWMMASLLLNSPVARVLEFGARYGTTSCLLANVTGNVAGRVFSAEIDAAVWRTNLENRNKHKCNYHLVRGGVGYKSAYFNREKLAMSYPERGGYGGRMEVTEVRNKNENGDHEKQPEARAVGFVYVQEIERAFSTKINAVLIDCEGCIEYVFPGGEGDPFLSQLELILLEEDQERKLPTGSYAKWHDTFRKAGFVRIFHSHDTFVPGKQEWSWAMRHSAWFCDRSLGPSHSGAPTTSTSTSLSQRILPLLKEANLLEEYHAILARRRGNTSTSKTSAAPDGKTTGRKAAALSRGGSGSSLLEGAPIDASEQEGAASSWIAETMEAGEHQEPSPEQGLNLCPFYFDVGNFTVKELHCAKEGETSRNPLYKRPGNLPQNAYKYMP
ncbi:unnamed protein product [Amoebophrya sp. A120]|nr:unnamed protein product [Amoebophrya sp. A120]|eukprot:GSA120T00015147001.1